MDPRLQGLGKGDPYIFIPMSIRYPVLARAGGDKWGEFLTRKSRLVSEIWCLWDTLIPFVVAERYLRLSSETTGGR